MKVTVLHTGQYHPYGDTFRVFKIETTKSAKEVVQYMKDTYGFDVPNEKDWDVTDPDSYFRGYYTLGKIDGGFIYTKVEPYDD